MRLRAASKLRAATNPSQEVVMTAIQHTSTAPRDADIDELPALFDGVIKLARSGLGITAFGAQVIDLPPSYTTDSHDETATGQEELYVALSGGGAVDVSEWGSLALEPGRLVLVPPACSRTLRSGDHGVRVLVIGGTPGHAYAPPPWSETEEQGR
jgi:mannose-6-phosphate isomerase-like protein (cupin superfamily)